MLEVPLSLEPMEAEPVGELPPSGWYEPKYDGFRCIAFRDGSEVHLQSRSQKPLQRYFPEIAAACLALPTDRFVLDGELIIPGEPFDALQHRLHPAASRVAKLSKETPAQFITFDLLADSEGRSLLTRPFSERRVALEAFFRANGSSLAFVLSKATRSRRTAQKWLKQLGRGLDGIMVKNTALPYRAGQRAMQKFKVWQTIDCVVSGVYYRTGTKEVEYLLLGLYDADGLLNYVGRCGIGKDAAEVGRLLQPLVGGDGFTGRAPGGKSRWSGQARQAVPLRPQLVAEVSADHIEAGRFRHGSRLLRWRDDKLPEACTMRQVER